MNNKTKKLDKIWIGFALGVIIPLVAFYAYYYLKFSDLEFMEYLKSMHYYRLLFKIMSLCVLADLPAFYAFLQFQYWRSSRGVVMACFIFAFMVMGYRLFN